MVKGNSTQQPACHQTSPTATGSSRQLLVVKSVDRLPEGMGDTRFACGGNEQNVCNMVRGQGEQHLKQEVRPVHSKDKQK